jgi:hypothetical protein
VLLYVWNPLIDSVRRLQEAADLQNVARTLGIKRFSLGSFSESPRVFDPEQLKPVIEELAAQLHPAQTDPRLGEFKHAVTLVDSTVLSALTRLTRMACGLDGRYTTLRDGRAMYGWRLHTQLDLDTFAPHRMDRTGARNAGDNREHNVLRRNLESGRCYVGDGGYADRALFDDIVDKDSSYVIRMREDTVFTVTEERLLSSEALAADVVRDALVTLDERVIQASRHPVRLIQVQVQPHPHRTRQGTQMSEVILLATCLDLPAELIARIYLYRYTIELFFRMFKQLLGMRHLLSQRQEGIDIQVHCTVIVCLLVCLITGKKPSKSNRSMIGWYLIGLASAQELMNHLNRPDNTGIKKRAKDELWKKLGY